MSKDLEPYRCDAPGCAKRRSNDANYWWLVRPGTDVGGVRVVVVAPWNAAWADIEDVTHGCGIDCMVKLVAVIAARIVDVSRNSLVAGKGAPDGEQQET